MSLWIYIPAGIVFVILVILFRVGFFSKLNFVHKSTERKYFLYLEHIGPYMNLGHVFRNLASNCLPHFKPGTETAGIYYDSPAYVEEPNKCRTCCGVLIDEDEKDKALQFAAKNPLYKLRELPPIESISVTIRDFGMLTYMIMPMKVYPKLMDYALKSKVINSLDEISGGMVEIYHHSRKPHEIEFILPYGPGKEKLYLTTQPAPKYKSFDKKNN